MTRRPAPLALALALALATVAGAPAAAQTRAAGAAAAPADDADAPVEVRYHARTSITIDPADIEGAVKGPTIERIYARQKSKFRNLIELRANFRPELSTSPGKL